MRRSCLESAGLDYASRCGVLVLAASIGDWETLCYAADRTGSIPVLALTAQAMRGDHERFLEAGFHGYLSKPVDIDELVLMVREQCGA